MGGTSKTLNPAGQGVEKAAGISGAAVSAARRLAGDAKANAAPRLSPVLFTRKPWGLK